MKSWGIVSDTQIDGATLQDVVDGLKQFVAKEVVGRHAEHGALLNEPRATYDAAGRMQPEVVEHIRAVRRASAESGYFNISVPTDMGGAGLGFYAYYEAWKAIHEVADPHHWLSQFAISHWAFGPSAALEGMTDRAKEEILTGLVAGEQIMCFGMSEPDAGSDALAMRTTATRVDGGWVLNGRKIWTSHAPIADWMLVFAVTADRESNGGRPGISAFMVPMDAPGIDIHSIIKMWDEIGGHEAETALTDVQVEDWQLVGELNRGFASAMRGVSLGRIYNSARGYSIGRWALNVALEYSTQRSTFGKKLYEHQAVLHPLAESAASLMAADAFATRVARALDEGQRLKKEVAAMKYLAVRAGFDAVDRAMQTHGAIGFSNELGLTEAFKTMRKLRVADGTDEILLRTIGAELVHSGHF